MATAPTPSDTTSAARARALYERQLAALGRLAEMGLNIAAEVEAKVVAADVLMADEAVGWTLAYGRAARAVRLSLMLQARVMEQIEALDRPPVPAKDADDGQPRYTGIRRIFIDPPTERERAERLARERAERGEGEDFGDLLDRPLAEGVAVIRRDLGLEADETDDWADDAAAFDDEGRVAASGPPPGGPKSARHEGHKGHQGHNGFAGRDPPS